MAVTRIWTTWKICRDTHVPSLTLGLTHSDGVNHERIYPGMQYFPVLALQMDSPDVECLYSAYSSKAMNNKEGPVMSTVTPVKAYRTKCPLIYS